MSAGMTQTELHTLAATALRDVLAAQFRVEAHAAAPGLEGLATVGASVPLNGVTLEGQVRVHVSPQLARLLVERLLGQASGSAEEAQDLCRELCNILAGHVAAALGRDGTLIELGTPSLPGPDADLIYRSHWLCEHEPLTFGLDIRMIHR
jgi:CheY-specific phosphatase CheX